MTCPQRKLGGSASSISVGQMGFGLMGMTWCDPSQATPDNQAFATMKAAADAGSTLWNAGAFYGPQSNPYAGIHLIRRFFDAHPEYKEKVFLAVKGGADMAAFQEKGMAGFAMDSSVENLEKDLTTIKEILGDKEIDAYEMARVDTNVPIEQIMKNMLSLSSQGGKGLFNHITLSEVGLETIKRALAVAPIAAVEIEYSPWEHEAKSLGIVDFCEQKGIPILAYSPIGKGMLTGALKSRADIPEGDIRLMQDKFSEENFAKNLKLGEAFQQAAKKKGCTAAQLALAWDIHESKDRIIIPIPGSSKVERVRENIAAASISLHEHEVKEIRQILDSIKVHGGRYSAAERAHTPLFA